MTLAEVDLLAAEHAAAQRAGRPQPAQAPADGGPLMRTGLAAEIAARHASAPRGTAADLMALAARQH